MSGPDDTFDRGPVGGDYVRYIEALLARPVAATGARDARAVPSAPPTPRAAAGKPSPPVGTNPAAAAAIGQALALGEQRRTVSAQRWIELSVIVAGVALALVGILAPVFQLAFVLAGAALVYAMIRRFVARELTGPARTARRPR